MKDKLFIAMSAVVCLSFGLLLNHYLDIPSSPCPPPPCHFEASLDDKGDHWMKLKPPTPDMVFARNKPYWLLVKVVCDKDRNERP